MYVGHTVAQGPVKIYFSYTQKLGCVVCNCCFNGVASHDLKLSPKKHSRSNIGRYDCLQLI